MLRISIPQLLKFSYFPIVCFFNRESAQQCWSEARYWYSILFCPSVRPSVFMPVWHAPELYRNGIINHHTFFSTMSWYPNRSSFKSTKHLCEIPPGSPATGRCIQVRYIYKVSYILSRLPCSDRHQGCHKSPREKLPR